jgi:predicted GNAT family N-acyltransferase
VSSAFLIEPLSAHHDRLSFACGVDPLDRYLQSQAGQDARRRVSNCFVVLAPATNVVAGYYTLSVTSVKLTDLSQSYAERLPRYPLVPAARVGRLTIDVRFTGHKLGAALLYDAMDRASLSAPAVFALVVDAKDETAARFYRHFGFLPFASRPTNFYYPLSAGSPA